MRASEEAVRRARRAVAGGVRKRKTPRGVRSARGAPIYLGRGKFRCFRRTGSGRPLTAFHSLLTRTIAPVYVVPAGSGARAPRDVAMRAGCRADRLFGAVLAELRRRGQAGTTAWTTWMPSDWPDGMRRGARGDGVTTAGQKVRRVLDFMAQRSIGLQAVQVGVTSGRFGTALDVLGTDANGDAWVIEVKTGYEYKDAPSAPPGPRMLSGPGAGHANTPRNHHLLQLAFEMELYRATHGADGGVEGAVVYAHNDGTTSVAPAEAWATRAIRAYMTAHR